MVKWLINDWVRFTYRHVVPNLISLTNLAININLPT